ncbi:MAG: vitamin B12-dependent ribonucleotide reductase [Candidatus Krumholzibacteriota bacterium]|nr:vitamin B12-dependent ribonucleotide reductase [Candidatus Krumholzibacteriota bacterium]
MSKNRKEPRIGENALRVLKKRYFQKDVDGGLKEDPRGMFERVASNIASAEDKYKGGDGPAKWKEEFYDIMASLDFLPNSPTLMNAGAKLQQLSACFVLPIDDSMQSIFETIKQTALIHKSGGGTGFSFSRIRPKNDVVNTTKGVSSGPISFMNVFDAATETVKQGGTRRGANMAILRVDHPDIVDFITAKKNNKKLNNFNISVGATERFMEAVEEDLNYDLINPHTGNVVDSIPARSVFKLIVELAWKNGEPGIVFLDRINADNPTPHVGNIESTNPCGEQPLLPHESCNLGSINLSNMVKVMEGKTRIDFDKLGEVTAKAVRFLDNVIDVNRYPLKVIGDMTLSNRKIGLGVMGFADMLIALGIPYNSEEALEVAEEVMGFIQREGRKESMNLAEERGAFPNFKGSVYDMPDSGSGKDNKSKRRPVRNATVTTIAPTGTLSIIAGCSSGVEPVFAIAYIRNVMDDDELIEVNPMFEEIAKREGFYSEDLMRKIARQGSIQNIDGIPQEWKRIFVTAHDISPEWHIRIQSAFQKYTDNAVSKTVNFSKTAEIQDVEKVYRKAYELGCKGVTIYRDGSREEQVLNIGSVNRAKEEQENEHNADISDLLTPRPRPAVTTGSTWKMTTGCGNLYVTINHDEHGPFELFSQMGKAGGCSASQSEAISRLISLSLRAGIDPKEIAKQLRGIRCPNPGWEEGGMNLSCSDAIAKALERYIQENETPVEKEAKRGSSMLFAGSCPECGGVMEHESGCAVCRECGYSKCG